MRMPWMWAQLLAGCLGFNSPTQAIPVTLTMVTDTLLVGRAILSGDYLSLSNNEIIIVNALLPGGGPTVHWSLQIALEQFSNSAHPKGLNILFAEGRHVSNPPPHAGEGSPGPLLALGGVGMPINTTLIDDIGHDLIQSVRVLHDNPDHYDIMTTTLIDLDPADPKSVTAGLRDEFRMVIDFRHIAEPAALALLCTALLALALMPRRRNLPTP